MAFRFATLALALAAAAPAAAQTADRTTVEAEVIEAVSDLEVSARGNAEIKRDDITIFGDELRYNRELGRAEADGGVRMQRGADRFFGPHLYYNTLDDTGVFDSPQYLLERERTARGGADKIEFLGPHRYRMTNATYTTCRPGQEDWRLEAKELDLDFDEEVGEAESPRLRFFDTTILASPWATFPLSNRRKSGLLTPYYAQTSARGFEFGIPYYWNIAPEYDATLTPVFMAKRGAQLKNEGRYLARSFGGELKFEYLPDDREFGDSREGVSWQHTHRFTPATTGQVDYNRVSDSRYFVDLASRVKQVSLGNLPQDAYVTHSGALGPAPYSMQARVQAFQTLQDPLAPIVPPYHRLPQINVGLRHPDLARALDVGLPAEYVRFVHPTLVEGARASMNPNIAAPLLAPGWFITPKIGYREASYLLTRTASGQEESPSYAVPWGSLDAGLVFDRDSNLFGAGSTQTLEPRVFYVYAPYRNQDAVPIFDTALADLNYAQLFTENRFVGGDRFGDANQLTLALTSRFLLAGGQEALRATVAQRYYFDDERVGLTPTSPLRTSSDSDILASIGGRLGRSWIFDVTTQYNPHDDGNLQQFSTAVSYRPEPAKALNFSYRFNRDAIRQIDVSGQWPIATGWYGVGRYNYSLLDGKLLEGLAGLEYHAGCWVFRTVLTRIQAATEVASTAIVLQLEFNGIGAIGTAEAVDLLRRNVPGYSVVNPAETRLTPPSAQPKLPFQQVF
jgi:LPS-assembly protein